MQYIFLLLFSFALKNTRVLNRVKTHPSIYDKKCIVPMGDKKLKERLPKNKPFKEESLVISLV